MRCFTNSPGYATDISLGASESQMPKKKYSGSIIRCPYFEDGDHFKIIAAISGGDWYKCERCSHSVAPNDPLFQCTCPKCADLNRLANSLTHPLGPLGLPEIRRWGLKRLNQRPYTEGHDHACSAVVHL